MKLKERLKKIPKYDIVGKVSAVVGPLIEAEIPLVSIGDICKIDEVIEAQIVGFKNNKALLMAYTDTTGIKIGSKIKTKGYRPYVKVGNELIGNIIDPFGNPLNNKNLKLFDRVDLYQEPVNPLQRKRITEVLDIGVRVINSLFTIGKGQRVGIVAGAGVGKSSLLGMIAKFSQADLNVIALIGERGREVREFIEDNLGDEGLKKSVVVVATSDQPPLAKIRAAHTANAIASYFANKGKSVNLLFDSLTRLAMAQREIGLIAGEPPTTKGYTPSVFNLLPKIIEVAGNFDKGSITGFYTVLVEGDDVSSDPVADAAISFLDGHIILSREIADKRIYPAVDILRSISRLMPQLVSDEIKKYQSIIMDLESTYREAEDMINLGLYKKGSNPKMDIALKFHYSIINFIRQNFNKKVNFEESINELNKLADSIIKEAENYGIRWD
ncbi:FliI/YscN family ATPase [Hydrogenivirga sp. 128-5-R1-1]|uniref:FliI/YscN family ATPase n=1 Tax=Hydrogenivirga sp. 128-5-R1-1 TaxID=392423 RepID=UPI00015F2775|nr:FliI/YscN family ATPase [Hydrogenivirga sp. 128-5-R1-1]EDP74284.1 flagellum-specific ATP synthase [Hydrogenivirga sp. 128-5-R1-1]